MKTAICPAIKLITILSIVLIAITVLFPPTYAYASGEADSGNPMPGDINGDGQVNILDLILLKLIMIGEEPPNDLADVDGNGKINTLDIEALLDMVFGKSASLRGGGGGGGGGGVSVANRVYFDSPIYESSYGPGTTGSTFTARVNIAQVSYLHNGSFTIGYDPLILQVNDVTDGDFSGNVVQMVNGVDWNDAAGTLTVMPDLSAYVDGNGNGVSGSGYFCDILFETRDSGTSSLTLDNGSLYRILSGDISAVSGTTWVSSSAQISQLYGLDTSSSDGGNVTAPGEAGPYIYNAGQVVNIAATPDACYQFVNWTGDTGTLADINDPTTTITMNGDYAIQANFAIDEFDLTTTSSAGGSVTVPGEAGPYTYDCGDVVSIVATPDACYHFVNWTGTGVTAGKVVNPNAASTTITMDGDYAVRANFAIDTYTITVTQSANGTISPGTTTVNCGADQTFSIDPDTCYSVATLTIDGAPVTPAESYTFTDVQANHTITATFAIYTYDLSIDSTAGGSVTTPGEGDPVDTYNCGTVVNLVATPASSCYYFVNWTGDTGTIADINDPTTTITMNGDYDITANFAVYTYDLSIDSTEGGSVTTPGEGNPVDTYNCGTVVNLVATPASSCYYFVNWTGDTGTIADINDPTTTITMNGDYDITANFAQIQYTLTVGATSNGSTTPGAGAYQYGCGTDATVTANPAQCYVLDHWASSDPGINGSTGNPVIITMDADYNVTPVFVISDTFTLTIDADPVAGGSPYFDGSNPFACGTIVNIYADPDPCYDFVNWSGTAVDQGKVADPNAADTTVTMHSNYALTANFAIKQFTLTLEADPSAGGSPYFDGSNPFDCGTIVNIYADPDPCYDFVNWSGTAVDQGKVANPNAADTTVTMDGSYTLTANYTQIQYTLTVGSDPNGTTTPAAGAHLYGCGVDASVTANPAQCYVLNYWASSDPGINGSAGNPIIITMDAAYDVTPVFVISDTFTLTLEADPLAGGNPYFDGSNPFDCGTIVNIYADPDPCYTFINWSGTAVDQGKVANPNAADTTVTMDGSYTLTANYTQIQYTLTVGATSNGSTTPGAGAYQYGCGTDATVTANPAQCYVLDHWASSDPGINGSTGNPIIITMDADYGVTPVFVISDTFTLTLEADPVAGGNPYLDGSNPFDCGTIVNIYADTDPCYDFANWTGTAVDQGKVANPNAADTTVTMHSNYTLTANYAIKQFTLTAGVLPAEAAAAGATATGAGTYNCSDSAPIQAYPDGSYSFAYWTSADPAINGSTNISESVLMDSDKSVTANFVINPNTVYFENVGTQTVGVQFTVTINITSSIYLTYAYFDLGFNATTMQFDGILAVNWGNPFNPTTVNYDDTIQPGLVRVIWDNSAWANNVNNGYGVNASGALCTAYFTPLAAGTSPLNFVPGAGTPSLLKWIAWVSSDLVPSYWINGSVTVE